MKLYHTMPRLLSELEGDSIRPTQDTPEMAGIRKELDNVRSMINLNNQERQTLRERRDKLEVKFQNEPRNDKERKIIAILSKHLQTPRITQRHHGAKNSGDPAYNIYFIPNENSIILYRETAEQLWNLGYWVDSVGIDFVYLRLR